MGSQSQPDQAVKMSVIVHLLHLIMADAQCAEDSGYFPDANYLWKVGAYVCILTAASLQGHEGCYVELAGLRKHLSKGKNGFVSTGLVITKEVILSEEVCGNLLHVTVTLMGHFKGETKADQHLIAIASVSQSGLEPRWWIEKLVSVCSCEGRVHGLAFADECGVLASSLDYNSTVQGYFYPSNQKQLLSRRTWTLLRYTTPTAPCKRRRQRKSSV